MFNHLTDTRTMAKVVIYARVSTQGQDYERQLAELREYARKMEYGVVMEFCKKITFVRDKVIENLVAKVIRRQRRKGTVEKSNARPLVLRPLCEAV